MTAPAFSAISDVGSFPDLSHELSYASLIPTLVSPSFQRNILPSAPPFGPIRGVQVCHILLLPCSPYHAQASSPVAYSASHLSFSAPGRPASPSPPNQAPLPLLLFPFLPPSRRGPFPPSLMLTVLVPCLSVSDLFSFTLYLPLWRSLPSLVLLVNSPFQLLLLYLPFWRPLPSSALLLIAASHLLPPLLPPRGIFFTMSPSSARSSAPMILSSPFLVTSRVLHWGLLSPVVLFLTTSPLSLSLLPPPYLSIRFLHKPCSRARVQFSFFTARSRICPRDVLRRTLTAPDMHFSLLLPLPCWRALCAPLVAIVFPFLSLLLW
ncbi:unnamed protein product [Closterium sp. Naga37s-1]|nr:unnamed protein product [Closterium sp. Naga37s-1]